MLPRSVASEAARAFARCPLRDCEPPAERSKHINRETSDDNTSVTCRFLSSSATEGRPLPDDASRTARSLPANTAHSLKMTSFSNESRTGSTHRAPLSEHSQAVGFEERRSWQFYAISVTPTPSHPKSRCFRSSRRRSSIVLSQASRSFCSRSQRDRRDSSERDSILQ